ncbi:hypothetical protein V5F79_22445 [Xanthobacter flavus]|uniref:hypothetical protein n=1 Tax=Xanthobacter flavus TaxID=281 RepID=UPI0037268CE0
MVAPEKTMGADKFIALICGGCAVLCIVLSFLSSPAFAIYVAAFGFISGGLFERSESRARIAELEEERSDANASQR